MNLPTVRTALRVLFFRATREELLGLDYRHLAFGLVFTWLAGVGRYWDSPRAALVQKLGLGSLAYVFVLAAFLYLILWPLRPAGWSYLRLLTFITLVSPPALLYAIPVERFLSLQGAQTANAWFLAIVASWRVALLFFFLMRLGQLRWYAVTVASLLPLAIIVVALFFLNLEHVVFDLMAGIRPEQRSPNDTAYMVVFLLSMLAWVASPALLIAYGVIVGLRVRERRRRLAEAAAILQAEVRSSG